MSHAKCVATDNRISCRYEEIADRQKRPVENTWPNHVKMSSISDLSKNYNPQNTYYKDARERKRKCCLCT